jgi:hypothetical protein
MKILKFPTEKIFADAWSIANSALYQDSRRRYLSQPQSAYMTERYQEDLDRITQMLAEKLARWSDEHEGHWSQYIDGHPRYNRIQSILEKEITK